MVSNQHSEHINNRVAHNNCQECRADCERQFLHTQWPGYQFVGEYLAWSAPRLEAIRNGQDSISARQWRRDFRKALHRRISLKTGAEIGRKRCDSYLSRLGQFPRSTDAGYLRRFSQRGASTLE